MAGAFVDHRFVFFAGGFHQLFGLGNGCVHSLVVLAVKAVNWTRDIRDFGSFIGRSAVKRISRFQFWIFIRVRKLPIPARQNPQTASVPLHAGILSA